MTPRVSRRILRVLLKEFPGGGGGRVIKQFRKSGKRKAEWEKIKTRGVLKQRNMNSLSVASTRKVCPEFHHHYKISSVWTCPELEMPRRRHRSEAPRRISGSGLPVFQVNNYRDANKNPPPEPHHLATKPLLECRFPTSILSWFFLIAYHDNHIRIDTIFRIPAYLPPPT